MASFYTPPTLSEMEEEGLLLLGSQGRRKFQKSGWAKKTKQKSPFESGILLSKYEGGLAPPALSGPAGPALVYGCSGILLRQFDLTAS